LLNNNRLRGLGSHRALLVGIFESKKYNLFNRNQIL